MATSSKLFSFNDIRNKPSRNGFDLSRRMAFTSKISELLPVCVIKTFPGDKFKIRTQHFTRTSPVQTAAFVRIREYFDWFFVPYRQLWRNWMSMSVNMTDQPVIARSMNLNSEVSTEQPYMPLSTLHNYGMQGLYVNQELNYFGFSRVALWAKLFSYFGYGRSQAMSEIVKAETSEDGHIVDLSQCVQNFLYDIPVDVFPVAAYHKIYNDYFRNSQWEHQTPYLWNFDFSNGGSLALPNISTADYWQGKTFWDMEYSNVPKDLFFGVLPNQQLGDVAKVSIDANTDAQRVTGSFSSTPTLPVYANTVQVAVGDSYTGSTAQHYIRGAGSANLATGQNLQAKGTVSGSSSMNVNASQFGLYYDIIALRQAEFLQKYKEIAQSGDQSYRDQVYKIWGVSLPDSLSDVCMWINGSSSNIDISEVLNTNFGEAYDAQMPWIKGKGVGVGDDTFKFSTKEHGVILCIYHAQPILDYDISGIDLQLTQTDWSDYPNPAFDKIGFEPLPLYAFFNEKGTLTGTSQSELGYVPRYISAKTAVDRVCGGFSFGLNDWVAPINDNYIAEFMGESNNSFDGVTYNFFKIHPALLDSIFGLNSNSFVQSDQFRINAYFDIKAVRNFDYNGLPY